MRESNHSAHHGHPMRTVGKNRTDDRRFGLLLAVLVLWAITTWAHWSTVSQLLGTWQHSGDYSAGQLIPLVAAFLVWREWKGLRQCFLMPRWWSGMIMLVLAEAARTYGFVFMRPAVECYSLILTVAGLVLMVAGWQVFRRVSWILLFLFLMVPSAGSGS